MRDEFSTTVKDLLAKRVAQRCSNPGCRKPTSGPQEDPSKAINLGVAAHIAAAAPGGPRYDAAMAPDQRSAIGNGIWLCQNCAKLIDNDAAEYTNDVVPAWRSLAEATAKRDLELGRDSGADAPFVPLERQMPALLAEIRKDLADDPLAREFVLLKKGWSYWARGHEGVYFYEDHPQTRQHDAHPGEPRRSPRTSSSTTSSATCCPAPRQ